jgi:hypothetical protein
MEMIYRMIGIVAALAVLGSAPAMASSIVYSNTTTDTLDTVFYSAGPYSQLGDQIHLGGTDRLATVATVQFFNNGDTSTFDATLRLYQVGSPVGAQIGPDFVVTNITAPSGLVFNVSFLALNVTVPNDLIFTLSESNISGNADIGVDMFEPPSIGTSNNQLMIAKQGSFSQLATLKENVFFELDATAAATVPEPGTLMALGCGLAVLLGARKRRRRA